MKKRFSESQVIRFLREAETGIPIKDPCRQRWVSETSYYLWRGKFGGMGVSDAKRLKELDAENRRLKKLLAESLLGNEVTREALRKMAVDSSRMPSPDPSERSERGKGGAATPQSLPRQPPNATRQKQTVRQRIRAGCRAPTQASAASGGEGGGAGLNPCPTVIPSQSDGMAVRQGFEPWEEV